MLESKECVELWQKEETVEFNKLLREIDKDNPDPADIRKVETMISDNPHLCHIGLGLSGSLIEQFLEKMNPGRSQNLLMKAEVMSIKDRLGYSSANQIEKLIINQIMLCWVGVHYAEHHVKCLLTVDGSTLNVIKHWQENLTRYQKRYLKAIETLAKVRKLNIALQINIATEGGKQINVGAIQGESNKQGRVKE